MISASNYLKEFVLNEHLNYFNECIKKRLDDSTIHQLWKRSCEIDQEGSKEIKQKVTLFQNNLKNQYPELNFINVKIGELIIQIPKKTLCKNEFFEKALENNFQESLSHGVILENEEGITDFLQYIQTKDVHLDENNVISLIYLADRYFEFSLKIRCEVWLMDDDVFFEENFELLWTTANNVHADTLKNLLIRHAVNKFKQGEKNFDQILLVKDNVHELNFKNEFDFKLIEYHLIAFSNIKKLSLPWRTTDKRFQELIPLIRDVETLDLSEAKITNEALRHIGLFRKLKNLSLASCQKLNDVGIKYLEGLNLESLNLEGCELLTD